MVKLLIVVVAASLLFCNNSLQEEESLDKLFTSAVEGCSNFQVFKHDSLYTQFLVVEGSTSISLPDTNMRLINIESDTSIRVYIDRYNITNGTQYRGCFDYCNDVLCIDDTITKNRWIAQNGTIEIKRTEIESLGIFNVYSIKIRLQNVDFEMNGEVLHINEIDFDSVRVGWLPG